MRLLTLFASLAVLSALAPPALAQQDDALRIGVADDPDILDPTFSRTYVGTVVMTALCDKLFDFDAKLNIVPVLATGYEWADARTLLIRLRAGVQFQNGEKFDADAVKYSLERHLNASGSFRRSEIGAMDHVEVVDPLTVRVVMKQPFSPFVAILTDRAGMMLPPKAARAGSKEFAPAPSALSSASRKTTSRWSGSPAIGTRRAFTTAESPTTSFPTAAFGWRIFGRVLWTSRRLRRSMRKR
jgi:peptide/nickel transport system substrate-binding protein